MQVRTKTIGAATGLALAFTLSACSGTQEAVPAVSPSSSVSTEAPSDPVETTETVAYSLSDGSEVEIDPTAPLPAPVVADIKAEIAANEDAEFAGTIDPVAVNESLKSISKETGKTVVAVVPRWGMLADDVTSESDYLMWGLSGVANDAASTDKATTVAAAEALIASQEDPSNWELIITE